MKIVLFNFHNGVYEYASAGCNAVGGAERQQWLLACALAASGWSVTIGLQGILDRGRRQRIKNVDFVSIGESKTILAPFQRFSSLYGFLKSERPDWLYWRCASHLWGPTATLTKLLGVRTIFAAAFDTDVRPRNALVERPLWWPIYSWGLSNSDRIFVQHGGQLSELPSKLRTRAAIVPNMVNPPSATRPHQERQPYIAWVGMLRQPKRPDLLIEVARKAPNLRFVVCGGPSNHRSPKGYGAGIVNALKKLPNVEYRGQVAPDSAHTIIANASVLLCTSEGEGFPNIFLEAWASGTPVVSLKIDPDHIIERQGLGSLSENVETAVTHLVMLLASPQRREQIALRARHYIAENHSENIVTSAFQRAIGREV